jgi:hypothetical protein
MVCLLYMVYQLYMLYNSMLQATKSFASLSYLTSFKLTIWNYITLKEGHN